jgi:hypothetical protein
MSITPVLEVAIGLFVVYYILGSVVSQATKMITESLETRGLALQVYLKKIVGEKKLGDLINLPQVNALKPIRYKGVLSVFTSATESKMLEKIPAPVLVDAFFDLTGLTGAKNVDPAQLTAIINQLPDSEGKQAMLNWINQGVTNINDLRARTTTYFTGMLDQAAARFRANARSIVILFSIGITVVFGTDSIQLAKDLWNNAELRAIATAKANIVVQNGGTNASLESLVKDLGDLTINIGWWQHLALPAPGSSAGNWTLFVFLKILGLSITAAAVSQGSSFWYDVLKKLAAPGKSDGGSSSISSSISSSSSSSDNPDASG